MPRGISYGPQYQYPEGTSSKDKKIYYAKASYIAKKYVRSTYPEEYQVQFNLLGNVTKALNALAKNHAALMYSERVNILDRMLTPVSVEVEPEDFTPSVQERVRVTSEDLGLERGQTYTQIETPERAPLVKEVPRKGFFARMLSVIGL